MTVRAVIFGLMGAMIIAGVAYINDWVLQMGSLLAGHLVSVAVFMLIVLGGAAVFLLRLFGRKDRVRPSELAVAMTLMMAGCSVPISALLETFTPSVVMPMQYARQMAGWKKHEILQYVPPSMFPGDAKWDSEVMEGYLSGLRSPEGSISFSTVPWGKWQRCLTTWMPLVVLSGIAMTCMALIVHRQWANRERLRYPIAEVATTLLSGRTADDKSLLRNRLFWAGLIVVFSIHILNGLAGWFPNSIRIPLSFNFNAQLFEKWPVLKRAEWGYNLTVPQIYFTAIAFSFFLASDIGLSLGVSQLIYVPLSAVLITYGVDISSNYMSGGLSAWQRFGSFFAFGMILLYVGRKYYWHLLLRAVTFTRQEQVSAHEAWSARILVLSVAAMIFIIWRLGLNLPMTIMVVAMILLLYLSVARISAETGLFFIQPRWQPLGVLLGLFGSFALGPEVIVIVGLVCVVLCFDPSQALMPYFTNALKTCDKLGAKPGRVGGAVAATYVACLALAVTVTIYANYNWGLTRHPFFTRSVPQMTFQAADKAVTELETTDTLKESQQLGAWARLAQMKPSPRFLWATGVGLALVLSFSVMRLRFTWWPLHPVFFLVWGTWPMVRLSQAFLLGWFIKVIVTRLGGNATYQATKPLMIGVIAGDLLGGGIWMLYGAIYYGIYKLTPSSYWVFPH